MNNDIWSPLLTDLAAYLSLGFLFGFFYRLLLRYLAKDTSHGKAKNINSGGRWTRGILGLALLLIAYFFFWSPILLFFAGFCFFESIFSWCGLYAAIGKDTCPLE